MAETNEVKTKIFQPAKVDELDLNGFVKCLTGPSKDIKWKVAFYLPIPEVDALNKIDNTACQERYNCDMIDIFAKGLNVIGHSIASKAVFSQKEEKDSKGKVVVKAMLDGKGEPTKECVAKIQTLAGALQAGRVGPTKAEKMKADAKAEAEASLLTKFKVGSLEELEAKLAKLK